MEYEAKQPVYLPVLDYLQLELRLMETRPGVNPEAFVTGLVQRWLAKESERETLRQNGPALHGYQWKNLFLPDGTILRTGHGDNVEFAKVSGNHILSENGAALTPSMFANRHAKGRNAWRFVWLRFPGDAHWIRADDCRMRCGDTSRKQSSEMAERYMSV